MMYQPTRPTLLADMRRTAATIVMAALGVLAVACGSAHATTASNGTVWGAVGDSITWGWGSSTQTFANGLVSDPHAYPVLAGLPAEGMPGQCLTATGCGFGGSWDAQPLTDTFPTELAALKGLGVNAVVVEIGTNDLTQNVTDRQFTIAYRLLQSTGKAQGVRVVLSTITPRRGLTADQEAQRERINTWIQSKGPSVNYADALGGNTLLPQYDSGDGIHPSDAGYVAMADRLMAWIGGHQKAGARAPVCVRAPCSPAR